MLNPFPRLIVAHTPVVPEDSPAHKYARVGATVGILLIKQACPPERGRKTHVEVSVLLTKHGCFFFDGVDGRNVSF